MRASCSALIVLSIALQASDLGGELIWVRLTNFDFPLPAVVVLFGDTYIPAEVGSPFHSSSLDPSLTCSIRSYFNIRVDIPLRFQVSSSS